MAKPVGSGRQRAPHVNLFDMPELLPGAQPSANPAQREEFEQRCRRIHDEEESERREEVENARAAAGATAASSVSELEAMFPNLDGALVRAIRADAPSAQHALETLLELSAAAADPSCGALEAAATTPLPPINVGVEDHEKFPSLMDKDGWQVGSERAFAAAAVAASETEESLGSDWRDRAKAAADIAPEPRKAPVATAWGAQAAAERRRKAERKAAAQEDEDRERQLPLTDYESRQMAGQRRAKHRALYARGGRGRGVVVGPAVGRGRGLPRHEEAESESEASEEG